MPKKANFKKIKTSKGNILITFLGLGLLLAIIIVLILYRLTFETNSRNIVKRSSSHLPTIRKSPIGANDTLRVPILIYHYVENVNDTRDTIRQSLNVPPKIFEEQLQTLLNANYHFMTVSDLAQVMNGEKNLPVRPIILTFDDGHWDLATDVLPLLKKYNISATAYIVPGLIDKLDYLTTSQLEEVINSNLVEIGDHTVHHTNLKGQLPSVVQFEVFESKKILEQKYNLKVTTFAYPYGSFDEFSEKTVISSGFSAAVSTLPGIDHSLQTRFHLYRLRPGQRTGTALLDYLSQNKFKSY